MGGAVAAIEQGFQKAEIERSAYQVAVEIDAGDRTMVGVNTFTVDENEHYEPLRVNPAIESEQCARLATLRAGRDNERVATLLQQIRDTAAGPDNPLPDA